MKKNPIMQKYILRNWLRSLKLGYRLVCFVIKSAMDRRSILHENDGDMADVSSDKCNENDVAENESCH